jgi:hypothetical protein
MRVLLDENVPRKLKYRFAPEHDVVTVTEHSWSGLLNGALLQAADAAFDALITLDRGLAFQQDLSGLTIRVVVVRAVSNKYEDLLPLVPSVQAALDRLGPGSLAYVAG